MKRIFLVIALVLIALAFFGWNYFSGVSVNKGVISGKDVFLNEVHSLNELNAGFGLSVEPLHFQSDALFELSVSKLDSLESELKVFSESASDEKLKELSLIYSSFVNYVVLVKQAEVDFNAIGDDLTSCNNISAFKTYNAKLENASDLAVELRDKISLFIEDYPEESSLINLNPMIVSPEIEATVKQNNDLITYFEGECK